MTQAVVTSNQAINWNSKGDARIAQNVANLLNTYRYEVAYDRVLGRDPSLIDKPLNDVIPAIVAEIYDLIAEYEPRALVKEVTVTPTNSGEYITEVVIEIGGN